MPRRFPPGITPQKPKRRGTPWGPQIDQGTGDRRDPPWRRAPGPLHLQLDWCGWHGREWSGRSCIAYGFRAHDKAAGTGMTYSPFAPSCSTSLLTMRRIACWRSGGWARSIAVARTAPSLKAAKTSSGVECRQNCGTMLVADAINPALAKTRWVSAASAKRKYGGAGG